MPNARRQLRMRFSNPAGKQGPGRIAQRLDRHCDAATAADKVIDSQVLLGLRVLGVTDVALGQAVTLLVRPMPGLERVLRRIAKLADGQSNSLAQLDVELNSSQSIVVRVHELPLEVVQEIVRTSSGSNFSRR